MFEQAWASQFTRFGALIGDDHEASRMWHRIPANELPTFSRKTCN